MRRFFPSGYCTAAMEWYPMKVTPRNMRRLALDNRVAVSWETPDLARQGHSKVNAKPNPGHEGHHRMKAISTGVICLVASGDMYTVFFHGDKMADLKNHVVCHMTLYRKTRDPTKNSYLQLNFPSEFDLEKVKSSLGDLFGEYLWTGWAATVLADLDKYVEVKSKTVSSKL